MREDIGTQRILLTGASGFIGSHLCEALNKTKSQVTAIGKVSSRFELWRSNAIKPISVQVIDITNFEAVRGSMKDIDVVLHLAAETHVPNSVTDPVKVVEVNVLGTLNCLEAARINDVSLFIYAGTDKVYGDSRHLPLNESLIPKPKSPYDASKLAGEALCTAYGSTYGLKVGLPRFSNVYGPQQDPVKVVPDFITTLLADKRPIVRSSGETIRDYIYVSDVVDAYLALIARPIVGEPVNVGTGKGTSLLDLYAIIAENCGKEIRPKILGQDLPAEIDRQYLDCRKAARTLGWKSKVPLEEGIARTVLWYKENASFWK